MSSGFVLKNLYDILESKRKKTLLLEWKIRKRVKIFAETPETHRVCGPEKC